MSEEKIFVRTRLGQAELEKLDGRISVDEKRFMLLLDGRNTLGDLRKKSSVSIRQNIDHLLSNLLSQQFIVDADAVQTDLTPTPFDLGSRTDKQKSMTASQALHLEMLLLAEVEVERRIELEHELSEMKTRWAQSQAQLQTVTDKYEQIKTKVLEYKQSVEAKILAQQAQIQLISAGNEGDRTQRIRLERDLLRLHGDLETMQDMVEKKSAALDETLRQRMVAARAAEFDKRKQIKIEAEKRVQKHPQYARIRGLDFFKRFRNSDLAELLTWAQWVQVQAGTQVIAEGDEQLPFFVVVSGRLQAIKGGYVLTSLRAGDSFGEFSHLDDDNPQRGASVIAETDCELLLLEPINLENAELVLRMHIAEALVRTQAKRLRRAMEIVVKVLDQTGRADLLSQ